MTDYIRTKQLQPDTILALRELVEDLDHEVVLYKEFKDVPPQEQANVRNDMYVASEALRITGVRKYHDGGLGEGMAGGVEGSPCAVFPIDTRDFRAKTGG